MALKKTVETPQGFLAVDAYHRIESLILKGKTTIQFNIYSHKDKDTIPFFGEQVFDCAYDLNGDNPLAQAYNFVKTQPEFADAIDC